jgi:hypothetical protein
MNKYKHVKLNDKELNKIKKLFSSWICHDMRPFSIITDDGLINLLQKFIVLSEFFYFLIALFLIMLSLFLFAI